MADDLVIWKFSVNGHDPVEMPRGARILHVGQQMNTIFIWALCNPQREFKERHIRVAGTGHPIPADPGHFLGTVQLDNGLVFHLFEVK